MALFQRSVLDNYLNRQDKEAVAKAYRKFSKYFHDTTIQQNIRDSKEEQFQEGFLRELFVNVFGYTLNPLANYNLTSEFKNLKGAKKADGAILVEGKALGVIELKGTDTKNLEQVRQQAFDYKSHHPTCIYVITSNFERIRFYINNAVDFEEFDLFTIREDQFARLYLCLAKENLINNIPLKIKEASIQEEEKITKKFYSDYSLFKRELFRDLVKLNLKNEVFRAELIKEDTERANKNIKHTLFKKSQKLIDRFLFIYFAEDRDLLPPNSSLKILEQWHSLKDMDAYAPLYDRFKLYFNFLDTGRKGTDKSAEIFAYNGGLFKPDPILDSLQISDDLLYKHTKALSIYDFQSQVDVNILGHIFENSLNEIESVNAEIEGVEFDKQKTKRKKDGVFYTPKYITKYIVDNTIGKLCEEKKKELQINEEEYLKNRKGRTAVKLTELKNKLDTYREWMMQLTICDPACGSGAFLNQALDFLIKEHNSIDELQTQLLGGGFVFPDIENTILERNIYGVDLNEESVEIAKLSLWLRTAQPRRKLNDLSNNIKCGNSLIDSKAIAGDKAFNWEKEFPEVFAKGGFDVVIGNPPYLRIQGLQNAYPEMVSFYNMHFKSATGNYDIYALFIEHSFKLINNSGFVSFILPHKFLISDFGIGIRGFLLEENAIESIIHFGSDLVFKDAATYTCIITLSKKVKVSLLFSQVKLNQLFEDIELNEVSMSDLTNEQWILTDSSAEKALKRISTQPIQLKDVFDRFVQGIITGKDAVFCLTGDVSGNYLEIQTGNGKNYLIERSILKPHLRGEDIGRYKSLTNNEWLIFPYHIKNGKATLYSQDEMQKKFPKAWEYLKLFEKELRERENNKFDNECWYQYSRNQAISVLEQPKIITPEVCYGGSMTLDLNSFYHNSKCHTLLLKENSGYTYKSILPFLNSKLFWFYLSNSGNILRGGYVGVKRRVLEPFALPKPEFVDHICFATLSDDISLKISLFQTIVSTFSSHLCSKFEIIKPSKRVQNWYELDFKDFLNELKKCRISLSLSDEAEWMQYFYQQKQKSQELKAQIDNIDREIDKMVYELYGLTEEEIRIVEGESGTN